METTEIILIRHGETAENLQGILQGHLDTVLNANGIAQAEAAARRLKREAPFQALYSSDLKRAVMTAEIIAGYLRLPVNLNPRLREWHLGEYEGRNWKELEEHAKPVMEAFRHEPRQEIKISGGETRAEFQLRVEAVLRRVKELREQQTTATLSYGNIRLDQERHSVLVDGNSISLTHTEYGLLELFMLHPGRVFTRDNLLNEVWGYDFVGEEKAVNIHIMNLRRKLDTDLIETIRGVGYRLGKEN